MQKNIANEAAFWGNAYFNDLKKILWNDRKLFLLITVSAKS
jgi:hypothetical protein